jgi:anti-sigma-K factor RskA
MRAGEGPIDRHDCAGNAAPYVLGALAEPEHDAFRAHMESCVVCREEVASLQVVAASLPATAPRVSAPPQLKRRVMSSVREDARRRRSELAPQRPRDAAPAWLRRRPAVAAAAVAAIAIVLAAVALVPGGGGGARVIRAEVLVPRASAALRVSGARAQLTIAHMPQAATGRVYQVWIKRTGAPQPTDALFDVTSGGSATVGVPGGVAGVRQVMVTSEPRGGSRAPTSAPVIVAQVG